MKVALIVPSTLWSSPFVRIYSNSLKEKNIDFDIIFWNRDGKDEAEGIQYNYIQPLNIGSFSKFIGYWRFSRFVKKTVKKKRYDKLIVFCPQIAIFITSLLKKYKGNYIFDYRDLSIEQKTIFHRQFKRVLKFSFANIISSPGFKKALPKGFKYIICHNFNADIVKKALTEPLNEKWPINSKKILLTIGGIRDFSSNSEVICHLSNNKSYYLQFVGRGISAKPLEDYSKKIGAKNIEFKGFYQKEEEASYIKNSTFLNIYYPRKLSHDTALSNRFYNSLIYKRPMVVTKDTTQGDFVEKYNVGIAIKDCEKVEYKLNEFLKSDYREYSKRCNELLSVFLKEQQIFIETFNKFISI